jgi:hypothetical protein
MHGKGGQDVADHPPAQRAGCTIARGKRSAAPGYGEATPSGLGLRAQRGKKRSTFNFQRAGTPALPTAHTQNTHLTRMPPVTNRLQTRNNGSLSDLAGIGYDFTLLLSLHS